MSKNYLIENLLLETSRISISRKKFENNFLYITLKKTDKINKPNIENYEIKNSMPIVKTLLK